MYNIDIYLNFSHQEVIADTLRKIAAELDQGKRSGFGWEVDGNAGTP